jgi:hypothetical protein
MEGPFYIEGRSGRYYSLSAGGNVVLMILRILANEGERNQVETLQFPRLFSCFRYACAVEAGTRSVVTSHWSLYVMVFVQSARACIRSKTVRKLEVGRQTRSHRLLEA